MQINRFLNKKGYLVALFAFAVTACSSVQVSTDYDKNTDFSRLKTFNWMPETDQIEHNNALLNNRIMTERVQVAVNQQLALQGFTIAAEPDFYISYNITSENKTDIRTYDNYGGYGPSWGWGFGYGHRGMAVSAHTETRVDEYQKGSLIIDVIDPQTRQLIWRGIGSKRLPESANAASMDKLIAEVVASILVKFPPKVQGNTE